MVVVMVVLPSSKGAGDLIKHDLFRKDLLVAVFVFIFVFCFCFCFCLHVFVSVVGVGVRF